MTVFRRGCVRHAQLLGGVGVMNIMLVTVSERTSRIGLRAASRRSRKRVMLDFFAEGCLLRVDKRLALGWRLPFGLVAQNRADARCEFPGCL